MYSVEFSDLSKRQLSKLPREVQARVISALERIRVRPEDYLSRLVGLPGYKLRVGDYRVLIELRGDLIFVFKVGHRKNVYDRL